MVTFPPLANSSPFSSVLERALQFLESQQKADGSFETYSAANQDFNHAHRFNSVFSSCLILQNLVALPKSHNNKLLQERLAQFLGDQKSPNWSWNYWARQSSEFTTLAYPDDLDDTFCAAAALQLYNPELINQSALAKLIHILTFCEVAEGGPYITWIVKKDADPVWRDVDLVVNTNIAYFLGLHQVKLPKLNQFFEEKILQDNLSSLYYPSIFSLMYFLTRVYQGKKKSLLRKKIWQLANAEQRWATPLETALAILSLLALGEKKNHLEKAASYLYLAQQKDGSWPIGIFTLE